MRVVSVLDDFDESLQSPLRRCTWDWLREWGSRPVLRFVTGSRVLLSEVCRSTEALTSELWNIFPAPVRLGPYQPADWDDFLLPFAARSISFQEGIG